MTVIRDARFGELDATTIYALLRLRVDVFVVEQRCSYAELDGRDLEPSTRHCWLADDGRVLAYLRLLAEPDGTTRLGRVATAGTARGQGHAATLLRHALATTVGPLVCDAQAHLAGWYARFGFRPSGTEFDEDGIPHVPLRLDRG